jgi:hypothetical protein
MAEFTDVVFQDHEDVWQDAEDTWHRGIILDALKGCILVNPRLSATAILVVSPLMSGVNSVIEYLKGIVEVKPYE